MLRQILSGVFLALALVLTGAAAFAAESAAMVIDARNGKVLYSQNANVRLYPASLTKMMTLYVTFEAIRDGQISLNTMVRISRKAADQPPSKLGMRVGQRIQLRYLIRAAAIKSANDAAEAIGEAVGGSEAAFVRRMNRTAKALGMTRTTFRNTNGLTLKGHLSTARDMTTLARHLLYDFPQYYNLFSRREARVDGKMIYNTNRRFLASYRGSDGIKTGYTAAAGFNLVASAKRGNKRIIATVFGGRSTASRNARMTRLLNLGFRRAPAYVALIKPIPPFYGKPKALRLVASAVTKSPRPKRRKLARKRAGAVRVATGDAGVTVTRGLTIAELSTPPRLAPTEDGLRVVARMSTSIPSQWSIRVGAFSTRSAAEKRLLRTALKDLSSLEGALRKVVSRRGRFQADFVGLTEERAMRACSRLNAWQQSCTPISPNG